jgi:AP-1 complex subunit sigma 1/2
MISAKDRARITREVSALVLNRPAKMCNFLEYKEQKIVYKR